ncbi:MAG: ATP-binding cassette domain-containing protein [Candidatus Woesearchaeota archaeon]|nr:ATP-binding cassette domain-containing protein [Candidatus Woesearchaeota archaeon]
MKTPNNELQEKNQSDVNRFLYTESDEEEERGGIVPTVITVSKLRKDFKVKEKEAGFLGSLKALIRPKTRTVTAVDNISFNVKEGEILAFIGPNGAGKSTTIKMLTGILHPESGKAKVLGYNPWTQRKELAYNIGSVFGQKPQLWYHLPAIDTFNLFSKIYELDKKDYEDRLQYLVKIFELEELLRIPVRKLSLGQRMRCEIAAALLHRPKMLFLDEPTIGLDIVAKQKLRELIKELNRKEKMTIFLTSHDTQDIEHLCRRIVIVNHGKIIYDGSVADLHKRFLRNKVISVKFEEPVKTMQLPGVKVLKIGKYAVDLEVNVKEKSIIEVVEMLMKKYKIADINISDPPIEEIISLIYKRK